MLKSISLVEETEIDSYDIDASTFDDSLEVPADEPDLFKEIRRASLSKKMKSKYYRLQKKYENVGGDVASKYEDPENIDAYQLFGVVEPPYNLEYLAKLFEENAIHNAATQARVASTVGLGYHWDHSTKAKRKIERASSKEDSPDSLARVRKEIQKAEEDMEDLFDSINVHDTLSDILIKVWQDVRTIGNGYLEIGRNRSGAIAYIGHIPGCFIRVRRQRDGFVQVKPNSGNAVFFRNFQDLKTKDPIGDDPNPNEIIHFKAYAPTNTYYGIPEIISAISAIIGDKFAKEYNIDYFENKAVPRYAIILKNAKLSEKTKKNMISYFRREIKGTNHGTLFIPLPRSIGSDADIKFEKLEDGVQDASFDKYRKANRDEILIADRVPASKVGVYDNANLAVSRDADKTFKTIVVGPDQRAIHKKINRIVKEFTDLVEFKFDSIDIIDEDLRSRIHDRYLRGGVMSPGEVRVELGLPVTDGDEKRLPYPTVLKEREIWLKFGYGPDGEILDEKETHGDEKPGDVGAPEDNNNADAGSPPKSLQDSQTGPSTSNVDTGVSAERGQAMDEGTN